MLNKLGKTMKNIDKLRKAHKELRRLHIQHKTYIFCYHDCDDSWTVWNKSFDYTSSVRIKIDKDIAKVVLPYSKQYTKKNIQVMIRTLNQWMNKAN